MKYIPMVMGLLLSTPVWADEALCDLESDGRSFTHLAQEGTSKVERLDVPEGAGALRFEARFAAFRDYDYFMPNFQIRFKSRDNPEFNLMFRMRMGDEAIIATTDLLTDGNTSPHADGPNIRGFEYRGRARQPFRADILWTAQGEYTVRIYTTDKGFDGPYTSRTRSAGAPVQVYVISQAAKMEIKNLRFGKVCAAIP
ncbi:hypothetical protein [Asticcacaulis sp. YBE204]|uniref:hypothetical protein n=1 Tax=Asticcacaulis sp. YBE204 TaxID=1282363 RepID=UPI0003C3F145|nr:hypothetical protein [Asticcacaulis sp. YBE204]ESQ78210.1 hypothetical protein AEYBE204_15345 [Asticcacaulis sp. YBE204]